MAKKQKAKKNDVEASSKGISPYSPQGIRRFIEEVKVEFNKIVWPDKKVTLGLTGVVILFAILVSLYLGAVDSFLGWIVKLILQG